MHIEQAIYGSQDTGGYRFLARSAGFVDDWLPFAERLCTDFGERPAGAVCPLAVFALPFGKKQVAVVQVSDQGHDDAGRPGALGFRLLVMPARLYVDLGGDPFWISDHLPPDWRARGELPPLDWPAGASPRRLVADLRKVLEVEDERTQMLLGGVQILVDGGRLVFERPAPDETLVRDLWALLPASTRQTLWPTSFAFANRHRFHVLVTPRVDNLEGYTTEALAGDYPTGHYEFSLQRAVEADDQHDLDSLLARRSGKQMLWLAVVLLVGFIVAALLLNSDFGLNKEEARQPGDKDKAFTKDEPLNLEPIDEVPQLLEVERKPLTARLTRMTAQLGMKPPAGETEEAIASTLTALDRRIDEKLGEKKPKRNPGNLDKLGPPQRRLRALLWKHGVANHDERGLNADELLERLQTKLTKDGLLKEDDRE